MAQNVTNKTPRPHGRSAHVQAHTQVQEIGLFDMIAESIQIKSSNSSLTSNYPDYVKANVNQSRANGRESTI